MLQKIVRLLVLVLWVAAVLSADVVELKTGERIEGKFKQANSLVGVAIEVGGQSINLPLAKVRAIYFGAAPAPAAQSSAPETSNLAREALNSLKALKAATEVGTTLRDYVSRLADTKVKVDEYLNSAESQDAGNIDFNGQVKLAIEDYEKAAQTWRVGVGTDLLLPKIWKSAGDKVLGAEYYAPKGAKPAQKRILLVPEN